MGRAGASPKTRGWPVQAAVLAPGGCLFGAASCQSSHGFSLCACLSPLPLGTRMPVIVDWGPPYPSWTLTNYVCNDPVSK